MDSLFEGSSFDQFFDELMKKEAKEKLKQYAKPTYSKTRPKRIDLLGVNIPTKLDWRKKSKSKGKDFTPVKD